MSYKESKKFHMIIDKFNTRKEGIITASKSLNEQCKKLLAEREALVSLNSEIQSKYFYYVHLENLEGQVILLTRDPINLKKKFLEILAQIEDAINFFKENPHYVDSNFYLSEYETLFDT